jgi:hypothetical protein
MIMDNMPTQELEALRYIRYEAQNSIGYITLNRPEKRNALNADVVTELKQAFEFAEEDETCQVIVLRGEGECRPCRVILPLNRASLPFVQGRPAGTLGQWQLSLTLSGVGKFDKPET